MRQALLLTMATALLVAVNSSARATDTEPPPVQDKISHGEIRFSMKSTTTGEESFIQGSCTGTTDSYEIVCRTITVNVIPKLDPSKLDAQLDAISKEMLEMSQQGGMNKVCASLNIGSEKFEEAKKKVGQSLDKMNSVNREQKKDWLALMEACQNKIPPKQLLKQFEGVLRRDKIRDSKTCKLIVNENSPIKLRKVGPLKWTGTEGPSGDCDVVFYYTLESNDGMLWSFSYTKNRNISQKGLFCDIMPEHQKVDFSWQGINPLIGCEAAEFE